MYSVLTSNMTLAFLYAIPYDSCGKSSPVLSDVANFTPTLREIISLISLTCRLRKDPHPSPFNTLIQVKLRPSRPLVESPPGPPSGDALCGRSYVGGIWVFIVRDCNNMQFN